VADIQWRTHFRTYQRWLDLVQRYDTLSDPWSDEAESIKDDIRSLPGYPLQADPERDIVHVELITN
jgi:hypothetical protein